MCVCVCVCVCVMEGEETKVYVGYCDVVSLEVTSGTGLHALVKKMKIEKVTFRYKHTD